MSEALDVDPEEAAWKLMRGVQNCRAKMLLQYQEDPNAGAVTLHQVTAAEIVWVRSCLAVVEKKVRHEIALLLIRHIDALDYDKKDKKASDILHKVLDEINSRDEAQDGSTSNG